VTHCFFPNDNVSLGVEYGETERGRKSGRRVLRLGDEF
jgi:hypothetical protein